MTKKNQELMEEKTENKRLTTKINEIQGKLDN